MYKLQTHQKDQGETAKYFSYFLDFYYPYAYASSSGVQDSSSLMHRAKLCISMEADKRSHWEPARDMHIAASTYATTW